MKRDSPTSRYLTGKDFIEVPLVRREPGSPCPIDRPGVSGVKNGKAVVSGSVKSGKSGSKKVKVGKQ